MQALRPWANHARPSHSTEFGIHGAASGSGCRPRPLVFPFIDQIESSGFPRANRQVGCHGQRSLAFGELEAANRVSTGTLTVAPTLDPDQSGAFRDKLLTEVENVTSADCAAGWAREALAASQPMPSSWRMHLSGGYPGSHSPKQPNSPVVISLQPRLQRTSVVATVLSQEASTKVSWRLLHPAGIATRSIFGLSLNNRVSCAPASHRTRIISIRPTTGAGPQGQRRVHGSALPDTPPGGT